MRKIEKIRLLEEMKGSCSKKKFLMEMERLGIYKKNCNDYLVTEPVDIRKELERIPEADYELCSALLSVLSRQDNFLSFGADIYVKQILNRMILLLQ